MCFPCCGLKTGLAANAIIEGLSVVIDDNCCGCNLASYSHMCNLPNVQLVYITYHVDVGETPFLIAVDLDQRAIVICIRGTLSFKVSLASDCSLNRDYFQSVEGKKYSFKKCKALVSHNSFHKWPLPFTNRLKTYKKSFEKEDYWMMFWNMKTSCDEPKMEKGKFQISVDWYFWFQSTIC